MKNLNSKLPTGSELYQDPNRIFEPDYVKKLPKFHRDLYRGLPSSRPEVVRPLKSKELVL